MGVGHDGSLATVGFCGCAGCGAGDQAAAGGSLRQALTGLEHGPEMRLLLPLIGRKRALRRLAGETA